MKATDQLASKGVQLAPSITRLLANDAMGKEGLIPLWFGEPNLPTPEFICRAASQSLEAGETFYTEGLGRPFLRQGIAEYMTELYRRPISDKRIAVTVSGGNAINLAFQALLEPGDKVATLVPAFPNLLRIPQLQGAELITYPLSLVDGQWQLDVEGFLQQVEGAKVVLINSPANPTGFVLQLEQMRRIIEVLRQRGCWLIADEVYARTHYDQRAAPSFLEVAEAEDRLVVVNSFSKSWAMTGWRLGWLTLPESLVPTVEKLAEFSVACAPAFSQRAALAAIQQGEEFISQTCKQYQQARDLVVGQLRSYPKVTCPEPESAFYAFFHIAGVKDGVSFARGLIDHAGVGLAPGEAFLMEQPGWFRLCFAHTPERLSEALERLEPFLAHPEKLIDN